MALIHRFTRAVGADLHALLDLVEDPEALLRQGLRDMEAELDRLTRAQRELDRHGDDLARRLAAADEQLAALDASLDLCLAEGRDDLARTVVRDKLAATERQRSLVDQCDRCEKERRELARTVIERQAAFDEVAKRAAAHGGPASGRTSGVGGDRSAPPSGSISDDDVEVALLAEITRRRTP